jgi:hypothetical protein
MFVRLPAPASAQNDQGGDRTGGREEMIDCLEND